MTTLMLTVSLIALIMLAMSIGVLVSNRELRGSCGGVTNCACDDAGIPRECDLIPGPGTPRVAPGSDGCPLPASCPHLDA